MSSKLISITSGKADCNHCGRHLRILCTIETDGVSQVVGSSCVAKFIPELAGAVEHKMKNFERMRRREKKQTAWADANHKRRLDFEAKLNGAPVAGSFLVKVVEPELLHGLTPMLLDDGCESTEDEAFFECPSEEIREQVVAAYEGIVPVVAMNSDLGDAVDFLRAYTGNFDFWLSLKGQLASKGWLSEAQYSSVIRYLKKQSEKTPFAPIELADAQIIVSKFFAYKLAEACGVRKKFHFTYEAMTITGHTEKAFKLRLQASGKPAFGICAICGRGLQNEKSIAIGIGPICRADMDVENWEELHAKLKEETVVFETWVPKSQIVNKVGFPEGM